MQNERFENVFLKSKDYFTSVPGLDLEKYILSINYFKRWYALDDDALDATDLLSNDFSLICNGRNEMCLVIII